MKFQSLALAALVGAVTAGPIPAPNEIVVFDIEAQPIEARQDASTSNELSSGPCKDVTFIFARGTSEAGNMGSIVGPQTCTALKNDLGAAKVACQGVGSPYTAALLDNILPQNTSPTAIGAATTVFNLAHTKCPSTKVVAGGYSQGAAVMDGSIQALPAAVQNQIKAVVLFGDTRYQQDGGRIPNYPVAQTKIFCANGDLVCNGTLLITSAHLSYGVDATPAAAFLASKV